MTNRRDVMSAAERQQLIEEHTSSLVGQIETLGDLLLDAEETISVLEQSNIELEATVEELKDKLEDARAYRGER